MSAHFLKTAGYGNNEVRKKCSYEELNFVCSNLPDAYLKKTVWPLFMDVVQLPQGQSHFEEAVYFLPYSVEFTNHP